MEGNLDDDLRAFVLDPAYSRSAKLETLWATFQNRPHDRLLVLDWLDTLQPIELADQLIGALADSKDDEDRKRILGVLAYSLRIVDSMDTGAPGSELAFLAVQSEKIQNFFKETAAKGDENTKRVAILALPNVLPADELPGIFEELHAEFKAGTLPITYDELLELWTRSALADHTSEKALLPDLLEHMKEPGNSIQDPKVAGELYALVKDSDLEPESKRLLNGYLQGHPPEGESPTLFYSWLQALSATDSGLQTGSALTKSSREYLLNGETFQQIAVLINQNNSFLAALDQGDLLRVTDSLGQTFAEAQKSGTEAPHLREALQTLADYEGATVSSHAKAVLNSDL